MHIRFRSYVSISPKFLCSRHTPDMLLLVLALLIQMMPAEAGKKAEK